MLPRSSSNREGDFTFGGRGLLKRLSSSCWFENLSLDITRLQCRLQAALEPFGNTASAAPSAPEMHHATVS
jgi:hypothetical protein